MKIGSTLRYGQLIVTCLGFTASGLVKVWDGTQHYAVLRERLKYGKERKDKGKARA